MDPLFIVIVLAASVVMFFLGWLVSSKIGKNKIEYAKEKAEKNT